MPEFEGSKECFDVNSNLGITANPASALFSDHLHTLLATINSKPKYTYRYLETEDKIWQVDSGDPAK